MQKKYLIIIIQIIGLILISMYFHTVLKKWDFLTKIAAGWLVGVGFLFTIINVIVLPYVLNDTLKNN